MKLAFASLLVALAGCAPSLPRLEHLSAVPNDSCHVRTWTLSAEGLPLPTVPLTLQTEEESDHLAGSLLGDWGRLLSNFRMDGRDPTGERAWFSGVGLGPGELARQLGSRWSLHQTDSVWLFLRSGRPRFGWTVSSTGHRTARENTGRWTLEADLAQEDVLPPGTCRQR